jgi:Protein of unknown function (DUF4065)
MPIRENAFSPEKALESVLFIASNLKDPTVHEVLKMRYFADKIHFSEYGFLSSGDRYVAMHFGPVPSSTYDLLKVARGDLNSYTDKRFIALVEGSLKVERDGSNKVSPLRKANLDLLSRADMDAIETAIRVDGNKDFKERTEISHDSAWKSAWETAKENESRQWPMPLESIAETLENSEEVIAYISA